MNAQEILNSLEILAESRPLIEVVMLLPRGNAKNRSDFVDVTAQDLKEFVRAVKELQKPEIT